MSMKFEDLVNGMVNVGFGAAAAASERGRAVIKDLGAKGEQVRSDRSASDLARSMSEIFERAGGAFGDVTARLGSTGDTAAERILDELICARARSMDARARAAFIGHVGDLVSAIGDRAAPQPRAAAEGEAAPEDADAPADATSGGE